MADWFGKVKSPPSIMINLRLKVWNAFTLDIPTPRRPTVYMTWNPNNFMSHTMLYLTRAWAHENMLILNSDLQLRRGDWWAKARARGCG
jgi:hypothetical protein